MEIKSLAVYSIVKLSELEGAKRIDAEYYKPEYLYLKNLLFEKGALAAKNFIQPLKRKFKPKDDGYFDYIENLK
ncbi:MAG: hypothetical protein NZ853_10485 [Leptospiraceae bacterium]|nr:hypothetical protein [Leptospiraceae bacterium]